MKIGIDISQIVHEGTGVSRYVRELVRSLLAMDTKNEYVLFGSSLRKRESLHAFFRTLGTNARIRLVVIPLPPTLLDFLWNVLHILPIEFFIGKVDIFWSSDWTQPPLLRARGITTIHDVSFLRYPESFSENIVSVQKRRLRHAIRECQTILCDSLATKDDVSSFFSLAQDRLQVIYPGITTV
ncbi:glycosyltransferase [Candidatus Gottesmanbacteria bacterium]|nr:glycosyltransferase [Candidatus Gottesmanbacteria bacterium]